MNKRSKEAAKEPNQRIAWKRLPDMPEWQREMERMFGDFFDETRSAAERGEPGKKKVD
jgi:hypothetical protein